jgi:ERF superfamily
MAAPNVYAAINAVSAELAEHGIAKAHVNVADDYKYRSIDDLLDRLAPLLAKHRLCVLPQVLEREVIERTDDCERLLFHVVLRVAFALTSVDDGSSHQVEAYGEALDASDKATAKAMSSAYKNAMVQTFCIPFSGSEDADRASPRAASRTHLVEPVQGWEQWARDIEDIVSLCESEQAINLVQERNRDLLKALSRERQELYRELGECFGARLEVLQQRAAQTRARKPRKRAAPSSDAGVAKRETEDA